MYGAFDDAMRALGDTVGSTNRDDLRGAVGMAIVDLAATGRFERAHLANYVTYRGRMFIDLKHATTSEVVTEIAHTAPCCAHVRNRLQ